MFYCKVSTFYPQEIIYANDRGRKTAICKYSLKLHFLLRELDMPLLLVIIVFD